MKRRIVQLIGLIGLVLTFSAISAPKAGAYSNTRLMDDAVFDAVNRMSEQDIRNFLNQWPNSCLVTSGAIFPEPIDYSTYGGNVDAARVIYQAAQYSGFNPQVIIATLQKEQTLITRTGCFDGPYDVRVKAMGYNCPDGGGSYNWGSGPTCVKTANDAGFSRQVMRGGWQLAFNRHRAEGNVDWGGNGSITYPGPWTEGNRRSCSGCSNIFRDGYWTIDGQFIYMETNATASLYRYTPHLGQSFPGIFESWFGSVLTPNYQSAYYAQGSYLAINPGSTANSYISYKNTGNQPWYDDASIGTAPAGTKPIHLATSQPLNRSSVFGNPWGGDKNRPAGNFAAVYESNGTTLAANQHIVQPGQIAKFDIIFSSSTSQAPGVYNEHFHPIVEGGAAMNDPGTFLQLTVPSVYSVSYFSQSTYPTLKPSYQTTAYINYTNTGNVPWYDDASIGTAPAGTKPIHLATSRALNRTSIFGTPWGGDKNRPAGNFAAVYESNGTTLATNQHIAQPGQVAKFSFTLQAPAGQAAGTYREYFQPIVEGGSAMNDPSTFLDVTVPTAAVGASLSNPELSFGAWSTQALTLTFKNNGNTSWSNAATKLSAVNAAASSFRHSSWLNTTDVVYLNEASVAPGATGSFTLTLQAPSTGGQYVLEFAPSDNTGAFGSPAASVKATVSAPIFTSAYRAQSPYPTFAADNTPQSVWIEYTNTGNVPWYDDVTISSAPAGTKPVHLATSRSLNRSSALGSPWGGDRNRPAGTFNKVYNSSGVEYGSNPHVVQPGESARFSFTVTAPFGTAAQTYREYFHPIVEGGNTMNDPGTFLDMAVQSPAYLSEYAGQSAYPTLVAGGTSVEVFFKYKNVGNTSWYDDNDLAGAPAGTKPVHLATSREINRTSIFGAPWGGDQNRPVGNFYKVYQSNGTTEVVGAGKVEPGQVAEVRFLLRAPAGTAAGTHREFFRLLVEGGNTMNDPSTFLDVSVQ